MSSAAATASLPVIDAAGVIFPATDAARDYTCPGESHPISRAVHYARMAAFYPPCRECAHRHDTGNLPRPIVEHLDRTARHGVQQSPAGPDGIRGTYLNEMTRPLAERYAAAFAGLIWERQPLRNRQSAGSGGGSRRRGPTVVVGQDDRPAATDLVVGVATALRRMGCQVIDVGTVSTPCFWYAVEHLEATGGVYVTGYGCGPAGIGLDFLEGPGIPWSPGGSLDRLEAALADGRRRTSRQGGGQRTFRACVPYAAGLLKHFHGLGPLRIGLVCLASTVEPHLTELVAVQSCRIERIAPPIANDSSRARVLALERLSDRVRDERLHAGVLLADDGQSCRVLDERGVPVATGDLAARLGERILEESKSRTIVLDAALGSGPAGILAERGGQIMTSGGTREAMARSLLNGAAAFGCDAGDRYWFGDAVPRCDGLTTLARVLQLLSRRDAPASGLRRSP